MSGTAKITNTVVPAQLSFLAIYNPSLGNNDEAIYDQVVYYHSSKATKARRRTITAAESSEESKEERNERLRQIGLAQGMVDYAKAFSNGEAVDSVESEKSRILLHELEAGWWILASIDLTQIRSLPDNTTASATTNVEYSAREVCPQSLLLQHLLRAHSIFLLHHTPSLADLFAKLPRSRFCGALERFWDRFVRNWDVLLNGNPAVDIYNGLKLAAGGELGIGVGEEEWGSGEREVLEDFIERTEGLVDLIVSRFGDEPPEDNARTKAVSQSIESGLQTTWLGSGSHPQASDGVIFSGVGAITRSSAKGISAWMEWIFRYGKSAYGIEDNPHAVPRKKRRKLSHPEQDVRQTALAQEQPRGDKVTTRNSSGSLPSIQPDVPPSISYSGIPPPIVTARGTTRPKVARKTSKTSRSRSVSPVSEGDSATGAETLIKYLTLGVYGSSWGIPAKRSRPHRRVTDLQRQHSSSRDRRSLNNLIPWEVEPTVEQSAPLKKAFAREANKGYFLVGLQGDLDDEDMADDDIDATETGTETDRQTGSETSEWNKRTLLRTLHVQRSKLNRRESTDQEDGSNPPNSTSSDRLRVIVYLHRPFMFTFLFDSQAYSLSTTFFYRSLHYQLGPLQQPLLSSTSPTKVSERLAKAANAKSTASSENSQPIYDLVYDPLNLTVHTTIPSIPEPGTAAAEGIGSKEETWTRIEALNVHSQILNTHIITRRHISEVERTSKTKRGWWVVWIRLPNAPITPRCHILPLPSCHREAILIRKASDYTPPSKFGSKFYSASSASSGWGPGKLAEGIGIDTRRYIEGILSLNR